METLLHCELWSICNKRWQMSEWAILKAFDCAKKTGKDFFRCKREELLCGIFWGLKWKTGYNLDFYAFSSRNWPSTCFQPVSFFPPLFELFLSRWSMQTQLSLTLWGPRYCSLPGSSVHGILQARILEWVAISSSRGSSRLRDWTQVTCTSCTGRQILCTVLPGKPSLLMMFSN